MHSYENDKEWLRQLMDLLEAHFGHDVEFVMHDLTLDYEHSIVDIRNGHVTGREVGGTGDILGLEFISDANNNGSYFNCIEYTKDGKTLRSSTQFLRDENGKPAVSLGINEDITESVKFENYLKSKNRVVDSEPGDYYRGDVHNMLQHLITEAQHYIGKNTSIMTKDDKKRFIKFLDDRGAFLITHSNARVCEVLNISQFTLYNYLKSLRNDSVDNIEEKED